jgi:hypothetical protein
MGWHDQQDSRGQGQGRANHADDKVVSISGRLQALSLGGDLA